MSEPNPATEGLRRHAQARYADVHHRIEKAIRDLRRQKAAINVNAVARAAGVTRKTIYRHDDLLARIRAHTPLHPAPPSPVSGQATVGQSSIVAALRREMTTAQSRYRAQLSALRTQLKDKDAALAAAHGEIERLRSQLHRRS
ncbi:Putative transposase/integrase [Mycobacteroides abscessus subsp. abscessus]|uniref:hypothetical protein n=1 Tax=Mycobacteroides abscessus TaxID=36809 RepID=UPI0009264D67|nr:hypothetical protein [Mycobacteroides abscessus]SHT51712.1 Putative transposase/integrase [Mycobacteroides abscessus subsp. abscessus]SHT55747.1 Putative transposase/integrase [Mycobacteroides abscessus subsp. abscessus]SHT57592.1 Putative transposase/integrase [Mycobacteroides abscessus subsp. abscessus]SHX51185.1 Putative transposase/integrase [Mycobacteroides abscessus subsp. abscessus]SIB59056.1 Putative transposase/integrase [Mycobacteroides abscessus subsp. abscessus]